MGRGISGVWFIVDQTIVQDGNERFAILGGTIIESGGGARIRFSRPSLGNGLIQDTDRHRSQQFNLGDIDAEGTLELGTESGGYDGVYVSDIGERGRNWDVPARESRPYDVIKALSEI